MSQTTIPVYRMNPAEDRIIFGDELADGMWVLCEDWILRTPHGDTEDERIRQQRFRRVTRLRRRPGSHGSIVAFVGAWIDGYQEIHSYAESYGWLVKKDAAATGESA